MSLYYIFWLFPVYMKLIGVRMTKDSSLMIYARFRPTNDWVETGWWVLNHSSACPVWPERTKAVEARWIHMLSPCLQGTGTCGGTSRQSLRTVVCTLLTGWGLASGNWLGDYPFFAAHPRTACPWDTWLDKRLGNCKVLVPVVNLLWVSTENHLLTGGSSCLDSNTRIT